MSLGASTPENPVGFTRLLAALAAETPAAAISGDALAHAKVALLDWLGCTLAGARHAAVEKILRLADLAGGRHQATILGGGGKRTLTQAALINGTASHVMDFDDTSTVYIGHTSAGMLAALVAAAEWRQSPGRDFLVAHCIASGIADIVGARIGMAQYRAGWHTTSTIGHIAAAAGCARLLRLDTARTAAALGLAGTMSSGLKIVFGSMTKSFHAGNACRAGLTAALLAAEGFTCADDFFEGTDGYLQVHGGAGAGAAGPGSAEGVSPVPGPQKHDEPVFPSLPGAPRSDSAPDAATWTASLQASAWGFSHLAQKYHASCHFTHSAIEALLSLRRNGNLSFGDIRAIDVFASPLALKAAGKTNPADGLEGKFSLPYCIANVVLHGDTGLAAFTDDRVADREVREYMEKVRLHEDSALAPMAARVQISAARGARHIRECDVFRDLPDLSERKSRIAEKFLSLAGPLLGKRRTRTVATRILALEEEENMAHLVRSVRFSRGFSA